MRSFSLIIIISFATFVKIIIPTDFADGGDDDEFDTDYENFLDGRFRSLNKLRRNFNTVYHLIQLSDQERMIICILFGDTIRAPPILFRAMWNSPLKELPLMYQDTQTLFIASFECITPAANEANFFVSSESRHNGTIFLKLTTTESSRSPTNRPVTKLVDSKVFPSNNRTQESLETEILDYFRSETYQNKSKKYIRKLTYQAHYETVCRNMYPTIDDPRASEPENKFLTSPVTIYKNQNPINLPLLACPKLMNETQNHFVALYLDDILFHVQETFTHILHIRNEIIW